jgi:hypothetical protein
MRCNAYYDARFDVSTSHMGKCLTSLLSLSISQLRILHASPISRTLLNFA